MAIEGELDSFEYRDIDISDNSTDIRYDATGYDFEITLHDLGEDTGVQIVDTESGEIVDSAEVQDGSVTLDDLETGSNEISIQNAPDELEIRDEQTEELIESADGEEVEVRFFPEGDSEQVETRTTTNGVVDFSGLPTDEEFVITVSTEGYETRSIYIDSILYQQTVYLLSTDADSSLITFSLNDRTDAFPDSDTRLVVQKPIGEENTEYRNIAGEYFGADGEQSDTLENGERYRLSVENRDGQSRSLGAFTPVTDDIITLETGQVDIGPPGDSGYVFDASTQGEDDAQEIQVSYRDEDDLTDRVDYRIVEQYNESNVLQDWVSEIDVNEFQDTIPLEGDDASTNWVIQYEINRDGETISDSIPVGGIGSFNWPLNPKWLQAFGLFAIVGTASLFGGAMSRTGGLVVSVLAFGLTAFGVLSIPYPMLMLAGVVAVLFKFAEQGDGGFV
ncbi:hypothetical protein EL22_25255 [Halostagnicola sp. A56]|uniref:hypothetical protein n=1 Tax=Halostagnicola sp. A56 TaxID=1495067 RepID=UPI0004A12A24|nr:hypothetical protein [Halostagnicola sp. A56]KDE56680.1 hypothetical protein EL22_25255 [Halostagnicola sp. A56]